MDSKDSGPRSWPVGPLATHVEVVMGTVASFTIVPGAVPTEEAASLVHEACRVLHGADAVFSTWKPESPMSRLRRGEVGLKDVPPEIGVVLELCKQARQMSQGWFDPWAMPKGLDPTGLVKGWAVERAVEVLVKGGIPAGLVDAGGDLTTFGSPGPGRSWRVGIRHPWRRDALAWVVRAGGAVATSGTYERGEHLVDPFSGALTDRVASATVSGPSLAIADALATALAVAGVRLVEVIESLAGYECYVIGHTGGEASSSGFAFAPAEPGSPGAEPGSPGACGAGQMGRGEGG